MNGWGASIIAPEMNKTRAFDMHEHRLRYAAWTSTRAISRGTDGGNVGNVYRTIAAAGLEKALIQTFASNTEYDTWHPKTVQAVIKAAKKNGMVLTFGQGAKLLAIYIKTLYIIPGLRKDLLKHAHPPVDRILLQHCLPRPHNRDSNWVSWSKFDRKRYRRSFNCIELMSLKTGEPRWKLEQCWILD